MAQSLMLFFLLAFVSARRRWVERLGTVAPVVDSPLPPSYSSALLADLPVKQVLRHINSNRALCSYIYPLLLPLVSSIYPQFILPPTLLLELGAVEAARGPGTSAAAHFRGARDVTFGLAKNKDIVERDSLAKHGSSSNMDSNGKQSALHEAEELADAIGQPWRATASLDRLLALGPEDLVPHAPELLDTLLPQVY